MHIRYRIIIPVFIFFLIVGTIFALLFRFFLVRSFKNKFAQNASGTQQIILNHINQIDESALLMAATISAIPAVHLAYHMLQQMPENAGKDMRAIYTTDTRKFLRGTITPLLKNIEAGGGKGNLPRIHFHLSPATSLLRLWRKPGDHDGGEDLSAFRHSIVRVNQTHLPMAGIEAGRAGIYIRGVVSIDDKDSHLGSVECFFPITRAADILKGIKTESLSIYTLKANIALSRKDLSGRGKIVKIFPQKASWLDKAVTPSLLAKGIQKDVLNFSDFKGTYAFPLVNIMGKKCGVIVYGKDFTQDLHTFQKMVFGVMGMFAVALVILVFILLIIARSITGPIAKISTMMERLSLGERNLSFRFRIERNDEIGRMSNAFNLFINRMENLKNFKEITEEDESLEDVYNRIATLLGDTFHLSAFTLYEVNNSKNHLKPVCVEGAPEGGLWCDKDILTNANHCRAKRVSKDVSSLVNPEICPRFLGDDTVRTYCIPVIIGESSGLIAQIIFNVDKQDRIEESIERIKQYLSECAPVIGSKRLVGLLRETTTVDALTGLLNRRFLADSVDTLTAGVLRRGALMGVLMLDIDFFKQVNDTYGHESGDKVLIQVAAILKGAVRQSDVVVRYGGEEFLILLMEVSEAKTAEVAEKIRASMEAASFPVPGGVLKKTISIGTAVFPSDTDNFWKCVKFADVALYKAKESGRNRVVVYEKGMWDQEEY